MPSVTLQSLANEPYFFNVLQEKVSKMSVSLPYSFHLDLGCHLRLFERGTHFVCIRHCASLGIWAKTKA